MSTREPHPFAERWLFFDPRRPTQPRLMQRFVAVVVGMLMACALLVVLTG